MKLIWKKDSSNLFILTITIYINNHNKVHSLSERSCQVVGQIFVEYDVNRRLLQRVG